MAFLFNSVKNSLQVLWTIPSLKERYYKAAQRIFETAPDDSASDFATQVGLPQANLLFKVETIPFACALNASSSVEGMNQDANDADLNQCIFRLNAVSLEQKR